MEELQDAIDRFNLAISWYAAKGPLKEILGIGLGLLPGIVIPLPWGMESAPFDVNGYVDGMTDPQMEAYQTAINEWDER